jgi:hypothetical protein
MKIFHNAPLRISSSAPVVDFTTDEAGGGAAAPPAPPAPGAAPAPAASTASSAAHPHRAAARTRHPASPLPSDPYLARLVKLVPSEVVALYLTFKEVAATWLGIWGLICLLLVVLVRAVATRGKHQPIQHGAVMIACVSFVLWVYATGGTILQLQLPSNVPGLISVAVGVWTFLVPYIYKGDPAEAVAA